MDNNADDLALVEKTIEAIKDMATSITANSAIGPKPDPEQVAETTNEQVFLGDAAIAPEAAPALIALKKTAPKKRRAVPKKSAKQVAQPVAKTPKKAAKKTAKKAAKKSSTKSAKKTKPSAGRKAVGKNKTAKKVAKKKKAK
ncbi:MAG TPA: hypothetical protein VMS82_19715 [Pseudolabrys sp.]|nr:hypothetical protein [Pseudolabrys sp.]